MASSSADGEEFEQEIRLFKSEEWWVAKDVDTGVASQGETRTDALANLDEAVALHQQDMGESVDTPEEEREVLRDLGIDPDEVAAARDDADELPEFMQ